MDPMQLNVSHGFHLQIAGSDSRKYMSTLVGLDTAHYPETLGTRYRSMCCFKTQLHCIAGKLLIINAPSFFASVWRLVSGLMDENTQKKVCLYWLDAGIRRW
jgi:hypothetical protein